MKEEIEKLAKKFNLSEECVQEITKITGVALANSQREFVKRVKLELSSDALQLHRKISDLI